MPFDTAIPGTPVTAGIASVSDLLAWEPGQDEINRAIVPCLPRVGLPEGTWLAQQPRVQHCHDLWQGYIGTDGPLKQNTAYPGDAFPQGCANGDIYLQPWWTGVDLFVYFGHRARLMIPPPWWTNAAHRNGVPVLGTFRVETSNANGDLGMLVDPGNRANVLGMLYKVARYYGFDGWFFNIEPIGTNSISPVSPADLVSFLTQLTALVTTDTSRPWFVVWYDSLNAAGHIHYEEQLDSTNQSYFQACSGMFVDYGWQPSSMSASVSFAQQLGRQPWDVYYGIQVHRKQENTQAVAKEVLDGGLSTALFAASWTYAPNNSTPPVPNSASVYWTNELELWMDGGTTANSLVEALGSGGRPMVKAPPYVTWFNLGNGSQMSVDGVQQFAGPWGHLSQQDPALGFWNAPVSSPTPLATQTYDAQTSFNGGTSLAIQRTQGSDGSYPAADLYLCPLVVDMTEPVRVYYAVSGGEGVYLLLTLPSGPTTYALGVEGMSVPAGLTLVVPDQTTSVNGWEVRQVPFRGESWRIAEVSGHRGDLGSKRRADQYWRNPHHRSGDRRRTGGRHQSGGDRRRDRERNERHTVLDDHAHVGRRAVRVLVRGVGDRAGRFRPVDRARVCDDVLRRRGAGLGEFGAVVHLQRAGRRRQRSPSAQRQRRGGVRQRAVRAGVRSRFFR